MKSISNTCDKNKSPFKYASRSKANPVEPVGWPILSPKDDSTRSGCTFFAASRITFNSSLSSYLVRLPRHLLAKKFMATTALFGVDHDRPMVKREEIILVKVWVRAAILRGFVSSRCRRSRVMAAVYAPWYMMMSYCSGEMFQTYMRNAQRRSLQAVQSIVQIQELCHPSCALEASLSPNPISTRWLPQERTVKQENEILMCDMQTPLYEISPRPDTVNDSFWCSQDVWGLASNASRGILYRWRKFFCPSDESVIQRLYCSSRGQMVFRTCTIADIGFCQHMKKTHWIWELTCLSWYARR